MRTVAITKYGSLRAAEEADRGTIEVVDFPAQPLGPEDVRIRVAYAAICGSDPHLAEGYVRRELPWGIGHEISGVVAELGERATRTGLQVGDRVACNFQRYCGTCRPCLDGRQQFCEYTMEYRRPGMSQEVVWHESQVYRLPEEVPLLTGCLLEPVSVAVRLADKARIRVGDRVAICGGGPIGQLALQILKKQGATSLTLIEPIAERRTMALASGADAVIDPIAEDQAGRADQITGGLGYDLVVDASGATRALEGLLALATRGGMVLYGAMYPPDFRLPLDLSEYLYRRELTLTGAFVSPYTFPRSLQLLPHLDVADLTRAVFDIEDAAKAFATHMSGAHPKVVLKCGPDPDRGEA
ncbi:MAG: zinc-binding dehydrogenase [Propioniciclava sp.]